MGTGWWRRWRRRETAQAGGDGFEPGVAGRLVSGFRARREAARMRTVDDLVDRVLEPPPPLPDAQAAADRVLARLRQLRDRRHQAGGSFPWKTALLASAGILVTAGVAFAGLRRRGIV